MNKSKEAVQKELVEKGYFKFASPEQLDMVIECTFADYKNDGEIEFHCEGVNRLFGIDAEFIYEGDGILNLIKHMLPIFNAMGITLTIGNYIEEFDDDTYSRRTIELNGNTYDCSGVSDWSGAFASGLNLIEEILKDFNRTEKIYGLYLDETSTLILLDHSLYEYLSALVPASAVFKPFELEEQDFGYE